MNTDTLIIIAVVGIIALSLMYVFSSAQRVREEKLRQNDQAKLVNDSNYIIVTPERQRELFGQWNDYVVESLNRGKSKDEIIQFLTRGNKMTPNEAELFFDKDRNYKLARGSSGNSDRMMLFGIIQLLSGACLFLIKMNQGQINIAGILLLIGGCVLLLLRRR